MVTVHTLTKLAGPPRIELGLTGSKPVVLPLHHEPIKLYYWCSYQESNLEYILTKDALYHLTMRAWCLVKESNLRLILVRDRPYH